MRGSESSPAMTYEERVAMLQCEGAFELGGVASAPPRPLPYRTLSGSTVELTLPPGWQPSVSGWALFEGGSRTLGFQHASRGTGLFNLIPQAHLMTLESVVTLRGGTLAHFRVELGQEATSGFTLWQGAHSDLFTFDHTTFDHALEAFASVGPTDSLEGVHLSVPAQLSLRRETLTVQTGKIIMTLMHSSATTPPIWEGWRGRWGSFYRLENGGERVLAVTDTGVAAIESVDHHMALSSDDLGLLTEYLAVGWELPETAPRPGAR